MKFPHFFIERPIFAAVLSILIVIVGAVAYPSLPIAQYPNIAPPTVVVTATYPGASAETLAETVAAPIEQAINGVDNMLYMTSSSTGNGQTQITVAFKQGTDVDQAQVLVQNKVATAEPRLPEDVRRICRGRLGGCEGRQGWRASCGCAVLRRRQRCLEQREMAR